MQVERLVIEIEEVEQLENELELPGNEIGNRQVEQGFSISQEKLTRRLPAPTGIYRYWSTTERSRRQETMEAACAIHGGSLENKAPATIGLVETVEMRCEVSDIVKKAIRKVKGKKFKGEVIPKLYKEDLDAFESSNDSMLRSIAVYYSSGVMGRAKYRSVYKATAYRQVSNRKRAVRIQVANCSSPRLIPYHKLMSYIKSIEIGRLCSVSERLCDGLDEAEKANGCYREIEDLIVNLAQFYLNSNEYTIMSLVILTHFI